MTTRGVRDIGGRRERAAPILTTLHGESRVRAAVPVGLIDAATRAECSRGGNACREEQLGKDGSNHTSSTPPM
eukprot:scaffold7654_cov258-Pinguiococcus_pyrenoidosus.AAC.4